MLMHVAEKDKFVPPDAQADIVDTMNHIKNVEVHVYPGVDHAFARIGGENYDKEAARLANYNTADFLALCLARKTK
jgi:carboxymethylenebutenolidase